MDKICYIFGAGDYYDLPIKTTIDDFVIAADGGYTYTFEHNIHTDLIIGDFDSLINPPTQENVVILPTMKDDTDMLAAIRVGIERGFKIFRIYGGTGGRLDHTLANIQCLVALAKKGLRGFLFDKDTVITAIHNDGIKFPSTASGTISVFAHTDIAEGVYETGLKYTLENATITNDFPIGISNEFDGREGCISVRCGTMIIIYPNSI